MIPRKIVLLLIETKETSGIFFGEPVRYGGGTWMEKLPIDEIKYALSDAPGGDRKFDTGIQALVLATLMQRMRDERRGINTAGFISGYRGSPLAGLDKEFVRIRETHLNKAHIHFQPGLNEDLAATSIWGSQQVNLFSGARYDGVFAMWYGKGPGVDRSGDAFKHANAAGSSRFGGVLAVAGDDHNCKSSTMPHQSEFAFRSFLMPVLAPSDAQDILDYALLGWELSRYSGLWVGFKVVADVADSSQSVIARPHQDIILPTDFVMPEGGLNIRWPDPPLEQELRLKTLKLEATRAFVRANHMNRVTHASVTPRIGIVSAGKSYNDVCEALRLLGIDENMRQYIGLRLFKVAMPWPLEIESMRDFLRGLSHVIVIEEKLNVIESQLKELLYDRGRGRPDIVGKTEFGRPLIPETGELTSAEIALIIANQIPMYYKRSEDFGRRVRELEQRIAVSKERPVTLLERIPYFCSGCPHNTSTKLPEGSRAIAGIGCHYMATWMDHSTQTVTHMGGEGSTWIGQAPFTDTKHVFQNLGDGTFFHSGSLGIRATVASGVNITFKLLYNDAVAMTGGQPIDGELTVPQITHMVYHEGVRRVAVMSDEIEKYDGRHGEFHAITTFHSRDEIDNVQRELREHKGVSVLIYDQTCAAEKRRRRKKGKLPDLRKRIVINERVCEGCGDCGTQSNCLSVEPIETPFGRKRRINQSSCNKDSSCLKGFCPSFVTVVPGKRKKGPNKSPAIDVQLLSEPVLPVIAEPYNIVITGIGGTGVITLAQVITMAAHQSGLAAAGLDMTGLSQKYGGVSSHVRIGRANDKPSAMRVPRGGANLIVGCDLVVTSTQEALSYITPGKTTVVLNLHESPTSAFLKDPDLKFGRAEMLARIKDEAGKDHFFGTEATEKTLELFGDEVATNMFILGVAYQRGTVPLSAGAIEDAILLNGVGVELNVNAFRAGRQSAMDETSMPTIDTPPPEAYRELVRRLSGELEEYQNLDYALRFRRLIEKVGTAEKTTTPGQRILRKTVARSFFKLLAYKDEYEVARLHTEGAFLKRLEDEFEETEQLLFHMAPPMLPWKDKNTGRPKKYAFGQWILPILRVLAKCKFLRGTSFDLFGYTKERRMERALATRYEGVMTYVSERLSPENYQIALGLANIPESIRGFGHVKQAAIIKADWRELELLEQFKRGKQTAQEKLKNIPIRQE